MTILLPSDDHLQMTILIISWLTFNHQMELMGRYSASILLVISGGSMIFLVVTVSPSCSVVISPQVGGLGLFAARDFEEAARLTWELVGKQLQNHMIY